MSEPQSYSWHEVEVTIDGCHFGGFDGGERYAYGSIPVDGGTIPTTFTTSGTWTVEGEEATRLLDALRLMYDEAEARDRERREKLLRELVVNLPSLVAVYPNRHERRRAAALARRRS